MSAEQFKGIGEERGDIQSVRTELQNILNTLIRDQFGALALLPSIGFNAGPNIATGLEVRFYQKLSAHVRRKLPTEVQGYAISYDYNLFSPRLCRAVH